MLDFRTSAMLLGAFGAGVVTAGFFLPGPPEYRPQVQYPAAAYNRPYAAPPGYEHGAREQRPTAAPAERGAVAASASPETVAAPERREPVRVIETSPRAREVETTGSAGRAAREARAPEPVEQEEVDQPRRAGPPCNVEVCRSRYRSFDESTCTFQPYDGPRRLCTR